MPVAATTRATVRRRLRLSAVAAGVALVAVPTLFTVFPKWADLPGWSRGLILGAWTLIALAGVLGQLHREQREDEDLERRSARRTERTRVALNRILDDMLAPGGRFPAGYEFTVSLVDKDSKEVQLVPLWPVEPEDARLLRTFKSGCGATGTAFKRGLDDRNAVVWATDEAVSNAEFDLTPGQQQFFKTFRAVVAVPMWIDLSQPAGVLSAISETNDGHFDVEPERARLRSLARTVGEVVWSTINPEEII